jgi:phosphatidylethanolamine-binding protein (PEBP) family uncharacterized protein
MVVDAANNSNTCSFVVTVLDNQAPAITCPGPVNTTNDVGFCSAVVNYTAPVGSDNCGGQTTTQIGGLPSGSAFPVGKTTNVFMVVDAANNSNTCSFVVTVLDNQAPAITCPGPVNTTNDVGFCSAVVNYTAPVGSDNCGGQTTTQIGGLPSGSAFPVGKTTNVFMVVDAANNSNTCSFVVTVLDNQAPAITCPGPVNTTNDVGFCSAVVNYTAPVGSDNCGGQTTTQIGGLPSGSAFPVGKTTNVFMVVDAANNSNTCSFVVTVLDNQAPAITCPGPVNTTNDVGFCSAVVNYTAPVGSDNCGGQTTTQIGGLPSGSAFPVGKTTNVFMVVDAANNSNTCSFVVTVLDNQAPAITCPGPVNTTNDVGFCSAVVNLHRAGRLG